MARSSKGSVPVNHVLVSPAPRLHALESVVFIRRKCWVASLLPITVVMPSSKVTAFPLLVIMTSSPLSKKPFTAGVTSSHCNDCTSSSTSSRTHSKNPALPPLANCQSVPCSIQESGPRFALECHCPAGQACSSCRHGSDHAPGRILHGHLISPRDHYRVGQLGRVLHLKHQSAIAYRRLTWRRLWKHLHGRVREEFSRMDGLERECPRAINLMRNIWHLNRCFSTSTTIECTAGERPFL